VIPATTAELAADLLGPGIAGADLATHSLIGLGGDSILALRLAGLAEERLGVRLPVTALLGDAPLADVLAAAVPQTPPAATSAAAAAPRDAASHAQRGMWINERVTGGSPYNLVFTCVVERGRLEPATLERAVAATTARHEGLRTVFRPRDGAVAREVLAGAGPEFAAVGCAGPAGGFEERVRRIAAEHGRRPFDVAAAPALRFLLVTHPAGPQALVLAAHHMTLDGWAVGLLLREIVTRYDALSRDAGAAPAAPVAPAVPLAALLEHEDALRGSGEWDRLAARWSRHLDGVPSVLELPADRPRPPMHDPAGARSSVDLGPAVSAAVASRATALGITPFAVLLGAFGLTVSRFTGVRSLLVGVPVIGRGTSELTELVAYAGNLVPVRVDVDDDLTTADYLRSVHRSLVFGLDAGRLPFEELVTRLGIERPVRSHPLVQVCFGMHDQLVPERISTESVQVRVGEGHGGGSQFDLTVLLGRRSPSLAGYVEHATAVWTAAEAEGFVAAFAAAAGSMAADGPLADVRCLSAAGTAELDRLNRTRREFPAVSLDALFQDVVRLHPSAVAVRDSEHELTYAELAAAAAAQAGRLRAAGVGPGDRVLVAVERSVAEAVAVLGTVQAGAAYVGVDPAVPPAHLAAIVAKAAPAAALARPADAPRLAVPLVELWSPGGPPAGGAEPAGEAGLAGLAYVAFTSGSTGEPKGVAVPHRAVVRLVHEAPYVRLGPGERVLRLSPLGFDASTLELWGALLTGATLEVAPPGLLSPSELGAFLTGRGVTVAWLTAGLFRLVEEFSPDSLGGLRQLLTGGDVLPHEHVARTLRRHPGLVLTNGYGPTENTTFTTTHSVTRPEDVDGPLPIGTPIPGTRVYVLDENARLLPPGAVGELHAAGAGLADGYLGDDAETARRFGRFSPDVPERLYRTGDLVRLDSQGRLRFLGRTDDQVKIRGYRVELSAIGDALTAVPAVRDAVVTVTDGDSADKRLVAAVVPAAGAELVPAELRDRLSERLPAYMVPALWAVVDRVPVTANGKVDRRALAALGRPAAAPARGARPDRDAALDRVLPLFAEAIDTADDLTGETDFFVAGGSSLAAVRLVGLVKDRLGVSLRLRDFLLAPTPAGLSRLVERAGATAGVS
jgi:amino acid adenylation domain-containing protein